MATLMIKDLAVSKELDGKAMSAVRGGYNPILGHEFYGFNVNNEWMKGMVKEPATTPVASPTIAQSITQGGNLNLGNALVGGNVVNAPQAINFVG